MIELRGITKTYGDLVAVKDLSLTIEKGDLYGFIGPNGAGKTTTIKVLATLLRPTAGEAYVCGYSCRGQAKFVRRRIGYMPDSFGVYEDMSVREYLEFFAALYKIDGKDRRKVIGDVLDLTDLAYKADAPVDGLSRGMQQRLGLARVLLHDPAVLLLDEPASGLDPRARVEMKALLKELQAMGKTILLSSHILSELEELCNKVGIVERGQLVFSGTVAEVLERVQRIGVVRVRVCRDPSGAVALLRAAPFVASAEAKGDDLTVKLAALGHDAAAVAEALVKGGFGVRHLEVERPDLEAAFMQLTQGLVA